MQEQELQETRLRSMNGQLYYQWIMDLTKCSCTMVIHVKSHTDEKGVGTRLNAKVDHYATKAQTALHLIPIALMLTFFVEDYVFYRDGDGWIESNIHVFTGYFMVGQTAKTLTFAYHFHMALWLYDSCPHPIYPYVKASSAYSAMIQLYMRSGQLPMAACIKQKKKSEDSGCMYGCVITEDMYHIFVSCARFKALRDEVREMIVRKLERHFVEFNLKEAHVKGLRLAAKFLFSDSDEIWLLHYSAYYLGHVPKLDALISSVAFNGYITYARFLQNVHGDFQSFT
jgi:hypothetical protein